VSGACALFILTLTLNKYDKKDPSYNNPHPEIFIFSIMFLAGCQVAADDGGLFITTRSTR
jgi:hypothetical protein